MFNNIIYKVLLISLVFMHDAYCAQNFNEAVLEGINRDRKRLHLPSIGSESIINIKKSKKVGGFANGIYRVNLRSGTQIICKEFKDVNRGLNEIYATYHVHNFIEQNKWSSKPNLPKFCKPMGFAFYIDWTRKEHLLLMTEKADGNKLSKVLLHNLNRYTKQKRSVFLNEWKSVGRQLALYHLANGEKRNNTYFSMTHGDLSVDNVLFGRNKISCIDYSTLYNSIKQKQDISLDLKRLFSSYRAYQNEYSKQLTANYRRAPNRNNQRYMIDRKNMAQDAFTTLRNAYISTFNGKGHAVQLELNGTFKVTGKYVAPLTPAQKKAIAAKSAAIRKAAIAKAAKLKKRIAPPKKAKAVNKRGVRTAA